MITDDKVAHFLISFLLTIFLLPWSVIWAVGVVLGIGLSKELVFDLWLKRGTPEWTDMLANLLGIAVALLFYYLS